MMVLVKSDSRFSCKIFLHEYEIYSLAKKKKLKYFSNELFISFLEYFDLPYIEDNW